MEEIVRMLWNRNEEAIATMEKDHGTVCSKIIGSILANEQDREEAMSDVWLRIWNSIPPKKPKYFRAYLAKTARNTALHYVEHKEAHKRSGITVLLDELEECIPCKSTEEAFDAVLLKGLLNSFLRSLKSEERCYFLQRYYFGNTVREIALQYGKTEGQVGVSLYRTRQKLRDKLEKEGYTV